MSQDLKNSKVSPRGWGVGRGLEYKGSYWGGIDMPSCSRGRGRKGVAGLGVQEYKSSSWGVLTCRHVPNYCFQVVPLVSKRFIIITDMKPYLLPILST